MVKKSVPDTKDLIVAGLIFKKAVGPLQGLYMSMVGEKVREGRATRLPRKGLTRRAGRERVFCVFIKCME